MVFGSLGVPTQKKNTFPISEWFVGLATEGFKANKTRGYDSV
jgi:hypothetical protein